MEKMETAVISSSDDDDDIYLNSVARLKALKAKSSKNVPAQDQKEPEKEEKAEEPPASEIIPNGRVTRSQAQRAKSKGRGAASLPKKKSTKKNSGPAQHTIVLDPDSDLEIVSAENSIILSDNNVADKARTGGNAESSEDEDYDINVKVHWRSKKVHRVNIRKQESFLKVFQYFADLESVSVDEILIKMKDRVVQKRDTPSSLKLSVIDILEGGIVTRSSKEKEAAEEVEVDPNACTIKVQMTDKRSLTLRVKKDQNFTALFAKCVEEFGVEQSKIKLYFDGESIRPSDTPDTLDIDEDEACFDLRQSS